MEAFLANFVWGFGLLLVRRWGWWIAMLAVCGCGSRSSLLEFEDEGADIGGTFGAGGWTEGAGGVSSGAGGAASGGLATGGVGAGGFGAGGIPASGGVGAGGIREGLWIEPTELDAAPLELPLEVQFSIPGDSLPFLYSLASGTLPEGVEVTPDGRLSGVPHEPGSFEFWVAATRVFADPILVRFELVVEKQRFMAARLFVSSSSTTTGLSVYDLEEGGKIDVPHGEARFEEPTRMSPEGDWLVFSTEGAEPDATNVYFAYLGRGLGEFSPQLIQSGYAPDCAFHPRGWGLACMVKGAQPVLSLYSIDDDQMALERQVPGGKFFGFRDNGSVFYEAGDLLSAISWSERAPGEATGYRIVGTKEISRTGERVITDWKDEGEVLGISVFDLEGWNSTNLIASWFTADEGYRFVETWDCPVWQNCERRIHFVSDDGEAVSLLSESTADWAIVQPPTDAMSAQFSKGVRVLPADERIFVDFVTESGATREVILPRGEGEFTNVLLSPSGHGIVWEETEVAQGKESYFVPIQGGKLGEVMDLGEADFALSPSGRRLLLKRPVGDEAYQFFVMDIAHGEALEMTDVTVPLSWMTLTWSRDESRIAIVGGNPQTGRRELYVVDVWARYEEPKLLEFCPPTSEVEPRCPNSVVF